MCLQIMRVLKGCVCVGGGEGGGVGGMVEPKVCPHPISQPIFLPKFPRKCQMSVKICLKNVLLTFSLYLHVRYLVTCRRDQEIWSVSRRLQDNLGEVNLALMRIKLINSWNTKLQSERCFFGCWWLIETTGHILCTMFVQGRCLSGTYYSTLPLSQLCLLHLNWRLQMQHVRFLTSHHGPSPPQKHCSWLARQSASSTKQRLFHLISKCSLGCFPSSLDHCWWYSHIPIL